MFSFQIRTRQNVASSPKTPRGDPASPVGEIDTRAPFQSVKAARNLFGEGSPRSDKPTLKKSRSKPADDQKVLEKETQLHWTLKELDKYKELLKSAESTRAQARRDLDKANKTLQELTNKLEMVSEGKQAAIEMTEAAKTRAQELELLKSSKNKPMDESWQEDVDHERKQYKTSANELISAKQELTNLKQDFDAALEAKLAAFQQAADAQHAAKVNHEKMVELSKEVENMRDTLHRVKLASGKAQEEHVNLMEDKEARIESKRKAKEEIDLKIQTLRKEHQVPEILRTLGQKLEETTEAINVLEEQLREVRVADLESLQKAKSQVEEAKRRLADVKEEEASIRAVVETLQQELERVRRDISLLRGGDVKREQQEAELNKIKHELDEATTELANATNAVKELELKIKEMLLEAEQAKREEENVKGLVETLRRQAQNSENATRDAEAKLEIALNELEQAKFAEERASEQMRKRSVKKESDSTNDSSPGNKIRLTTEEFQALSKKPEEARKASEVKVSAAMAQVETIRKKEKKTLEKLDNSLEESKAIEAAYSEALKMADMAEQAKQAIESELRKWRYKDQNNGAV